MDFLRAVLRGDKKLIKLNVVKFILGLEKYNELTLANLLETARAEVPNLFEYLPDDYVIAKLSREYVLNVSSLLTVGHEHTRQRHRRQTQSAGHQQGQGHASRQPRGDHRTQGGVQRPHQQPHLPSRYELSSNRWRH